MSRAQELYDRVLHTANRFLYSCKHYEIEALSEEDPTFERVAERMIVLAGIIELLADDFDPMMGQKALEYSAHMHKMGLAIKNKENDKLSELVKELDERPFL
ncbi:hypothetical protein T35B1_13116 [Salinisphaera shabanensis T35B1]|uniref:hypothetical protein n=1 Tax=Salinisphaera shabanensis TaxID=180542 RepID=UPI00333FB903